MSDNKYKDVASREGNLPNTAPQAPRCIPLSEVESDRTGGGNRAGNQPYNGDASSSRMRGRGGNSAPPPPVD
jgi:hypothetical protein